MELHRTKKLLDTKENNNQNEETAHRIGEYLCKLFIQQRIDIQNIQRVQKNKQQKNK
jgi:hypothetical protein